MIRQATLPTLRSRAFISRFQTALLHTTLRRPAESRGRAACPSPAFAGASFSFPPNEGERSAETAQLGSRLAIGATNHAVEAWRRVLRSTRLAARRSTVAIFDPGAALPSAALPPQSVQ